MGIPSRKRDILKALTWRIISTISTALVTFLVSGELVIGLLVGGIEFFIKIPVYYFHERIWYRSSVGLKNKNNEHKKV